MNATIDEQQPLLRPADPGLNNPHDLRRGEDLLRFAPDDLENPYEWNPRFKWFIVLLLACMAFTVTFTCMGIVPIASSMIADLTKTPDPDPTRIALLVTIWELGEAAGPLLIAPLSELIGRYPVVNVCNAMFIFATLLAAVSQNATLLIFARFVTGLAVCSNVLNPAIIGDMFEIEQRGTAISLIMLAPLLGGAIGPFVGGSMTQVLNWRTFLFLSAGLAFLCEILFLTCFRETYKLTILRRRTLAKATDIDRASDIEDARHRSLSKLWRAMFQPAKVLWGSKVLQMLALFGSVAFSLFYVVSVSLPGILKNTYGLTTSQIGITFISFSIGSSFGVLVCSYGVDRITIRLRKQAKNAGKPEYRLPLCIVGAILLPFTITAYGWINERRLPVMLLLLSVASLGFSLMLLMVALSSYVVDAFGLHSASALTGLIVTRCLMSTVMPLLMVPLTNRLGGTLSFTCIGAISLALAMVPIIVLRYGSKWRQQSSYTREE